MKPEVLLINGSPHPRGNTARALDLLEKALREHGTEATRFELGTAPVRGCIGCNQCEKTHRCVFSDDRCGELIEKMLEADGIIIGSPVYFAGPNGALCALLDRCFYAASNFGGLLKGKPGAAVVTCWRAGSTAALDRLNKYFLFSEMPIISSNYWPQVLEGNDPFGESTLHTLACRFAQALNNSD